MNLSAVFGQLFFVQTSFFLILWRCFASVADDSLEKALTSSAFDNDSDTKPNDKTSQDGNIKIDPNGYLIYCPCMGRFGNQADHFLGSLGFAKKLNRTLLLPPWRTYKNVPFDEWFRVEAVQRYHRAMTAERFMQDLAPTVWPQGRRIGWCWLPKKTEDGESYCPMKEGNPFGPFWDGLGVNFDQHLVYKFSYTEPDQWQKEYPATKYPVIALKGAPASFPVSEEFAPLQQYLEWSEGLEGQVDSYIQTHFPGETFVAIHLRNGPDWVNACKHAQGSSNFMASPQCLGSTGQREVTQELCMPSHSTIISEVQRAVRDVQASVVYVATDKDPMLQQLQDALGDQVRVIHQDPWLPQLDLMVLCRADHFIGNCVSSFTAFVTRHRRIHSKPTSFWAFSP